MMNMITLMIHMIEFGIDRCQFIKERFIVHETIIIVIRSILAMVALISVITIAVSLTVIAVTLDFGMWLWWWFGPYCWGRRGGSR